MESKTKIRVKKGLESFLWEAGRYSRTSGFHYHCVVKDDGKFEILHHNNRWRAIVEPKKITVITADDVLVVTKYSLELNGKEVEALCNSVKCYDTEDIITRVILAILLYYNSNMLPKWIYNWISG